MKPFGTISDYRTSIIGTKNIFDEAIFIFTTNIIEYTNQYTYKMMKKLSLDFIANALFGYTKVINHMLDFDPDSTMVDFGSQNT